MKNASIFLLMGFALSGGVANAATYHAAKTGSDGYSCAQAQSASTAKLTVNAALGCLSAGDTLYVRAGTYQEVITSVPSGTSWSNKVRIAAYPGDAPVWLSPTTKTAGSAVIWLDGNFHFVEFDGINVDARPSAQKCMWTSTNNGNDPHHIRYQNAELIAGVLLDGTCISLGAHTLIGATGSNELINLTIHGGGYPGECGYSCASYGVYLQGPNNLVQGCDIYDTTGAGIQLYGGPGDAADGNTIKNNRIHAITRTGSVNEVWGIVVIGSNNSVFNNLIYGISVGAVNAGNGGIVVGNGMSNNKLWNNTIYDVRNSGIYIGTGSLNEARNNIVLQVTGAAFVNLGNGTITSNNLFGVDPLFVNAGAGNFQLSPGSPAIDTGTTIATVATDIAGTVRPARSAYDIGAYEFTSGGPVQATPPAAPAGLRIVSY